MKGKKLIGPHKRIEWESTRRRVFCSHKIFFQHWTETDEANEG